MGGLTNEWMDMQYMFIDMQKAMIFQNILQFLQKHYLQTNGTTNGPMDQRTDIPSYKDAIATSKRRRGKERFEMERAERSKKWNNESKSDEIEERQRYEIEERRRWEEAHLYRLMD